MAKIPPEGQKDVFKKPEKALSFLDPFHVVD